jgi:hypothetical protein
VKTIILRHDVDHPHGLDDGLCKVIDIERKHGVRSTFFLRFDRGVSDHKYKSLYQDLEKQGWEFGLHLSNHEGRPDLPSPEHELETVRALGLNIIGVAACGGTYRWLDSKSWIVQDRLRLHYVCSSNIPIPEGHEMRSTIAPNHVTLDGLYLFKMGIPGGQKYIEDFEEKLNKLNVLASLSHPNWFYITRSYLQPDNVKTTPFNNIEPFDNFLSYFKNNKDIKFKTFQEYHEGNH